MAPSNEREQLAAQELESIRFLHLYADRKLMKQGSYLLAARQIEHRAWLSKWLGIIAASCFIGRNAVLFGSFWASQSIAALVAAGFMLGLAVTIGWYVLHVHKRALGVLHRVEDLLSQEPEAGHEAPAA